MFRALEELVAEKPGMFVLDLIDAAKQRAKEILLGSDRTKERAAQHPWGAIGVFMANLLTQSGVLLAEDGKPVPKGFSGSLAPVHSLAPEWQTKADAEILLSLLACRDDVSQHDLPSLAGALYHSREKAQGKVALAIACLLASNRAIETQVDGTLYLRANKDRAAAAQPMPTGTVRG